MKALEKVDRWGPITVALITLLVVIALAWQYDSRLASQRASIESLQHQLDTLHNEVNGCDSSLVSLSKWMIAVYERGSARGWDMPPLPEEVTKHVESEKEAVRPASRGGGG